MTDIQECPICGASVTNKAQHVNWHDGLIVEMNKLGQRVTDVSKVAAAASAKANQRIRR